MSLFSRLIDFIREPFAKKPLPTTTAQSKSTVRDIADDVADRLDTYPDIIRQNIRYLSDDDLEWLRQATAIEIRIAAQGPPDRVTEDGTPINPFWYHAMVRT